MRRCKCGTVMVVSDARLLGGIITQPELQLEYYCQKCHNIEKANKMR